MQDAGYAALQIIPSFKGFGPALERGVSGPLTGAGISGGRRYGDAAGRSMISSFASHARRAAMVGAGILAAGIASAGYAAFRLGKSSLDEAYEAQKVGALTAQVIKTTGAAANVTTREVGNLSNALSLKTGVDDEVIQRGANMLLTFKNIRNEVGKNNDIFNQSVAITEDMAAAMAGGQGGGQLDLKSSSILVGKALNDPVKGLTALTRVGVSFTDQQKKNIESLIEHNKQTEAQKIILGELQSEFGGAAEAQATLGEKVSVAWGNIQEKIGFALLPLVRDVQRAFLREGVPAMEKFSDWFRHDGIPAIRDFVSDAKPKIAGFIDDVRPLAEEVLPAASSVLGDVRDLLKEAAPYAADLVGAFNDMPDWAKKGIAVGGAGLFAANKAGLLTGRGGIGSGGGLLGAVTKSAPLPVYVVNSGDLPDVVRGTPDAAGPSTASRLMRYGGAAALGFGAVALGAEQMGSYLGNRPLALPARRNGTYSPDATARALSSQPVVPGIDPRTMMPTINFNPAYEGYDRLIGKIQDAHRFSDRFGVSLEDARRVMGRDLPDSADKMRDRIHRAVDAQAKLTPVFLGNKAAAQELLDRMGLIAKDWRGNVRVDTGDSEARLTRILNLANSVNRLGALSVATGGAVAAPSSRPRGRTTTRQRRRAGVTVNIGGRSMDGTIDDRLAAHDDLAGQRQRAGASR